MAGGSVFGNFGESGAPGFVDPFTQGLATQGFGQSMAQMTNRYNQLGLGGSTMEAMDLGQQPSVTGGIPQQFQGLTGELQNSSAATSTLGAGQQNAASQAGSILGKL